jgi:hypothetical protein
MTTNVNQVLHYQSAHRGGQYKLLGAQPQAW